MAVQDDIAEIKTALHHAERALRKLHNLLGAKLALHGEALGLSADEIVDAGTPKDEDPNGGG